MSERQSAPDLRPDVETLLGAFAIPERDWEHDARAIEARLSTSYPVDDLLLAAPLPAEPGEPGALSATATPVTNSGVRAQSLAELARRSVEKKQAEAREIARASLAIAAASRPRSGAARAPLDASSGRGIAAAHAPSAPLAGARTPEALKSPATRAASPSPKVARAVSVLALAAAAVLWLRRSEQPAPLVSNTSSAAPTAIATEPNPAASAAAPPSSVAPGNELSAGRGVDPSSLPEEAAIKPIDVVGTKTAASSLGASAAARANSEKRTSNDQATGVARRAPAPQPGEGTDSTLPPDPALRPADSSGGELPTKPSSGAVQAALGAVLSGARHCVAGDDAPSSAIVRFGSDGRVQGVTVSGPAAGRAAGACIEAQLTKARVQPFAASNFSVSTTIRPD